MHGTYRAHGLDYPEPPQADGAGRACLQLDENGLTPPSARPGSLHDGKRGPECGFYIQVGGIEQDRIFGGFQGRQGTARIARIPPADDCEHILVGDVLAIRGKFAMAAARTDFWYRFDENFDLGIRRYNGSRIATVEHCTTWLVGKIFLQLEQSRPYFLNCRDARGSIAKAFHL